MCVCSRERLESSIFLVDPEATLFFVAINSEIGGSAYIHDAVYPVRAAEQKNRK